MRRLTVLCPCFLAVGVLVWAVPEGFAADLDPASARVRAAWAAGLFEARVAFDRPIAPELVKDVVGRSITFEAGDTRGALRVAAARADEGGRTLVLTTDPHPRDALYTLELPTTPKPTRITYDVSGVEVVWTGDGDDPAKSTPGWWMSPDPAQVRAQCGRSAEHARSLGWLERKGKLAINTMLTLPKGPVALTVSGSVPVEATFNGEPPSSTTNGASVFRTESTGDAMLLSMTLETGSDPLTLKVSQKPGSGRDVPVSERQYKLPWVPAAPPAASPLTDVPDLKGGDPRKGAIVFASAEAKCAGCHKVRGEGGTVGPDLSGLVGRDRKGVYRDIAEPSATIHPDYLPYTLALKDGRILVGTVRAEGADAVRVSDTEAKVTVLRRAEVDEFRPGATSVMPVGLAGVLGEEKLRDLIAFLTAAPAK